MRCSMYRIVRRCEYLLDVSCKGAVLQECLEECHTKMSNNKCPGKVTALQVSCNLCLAKVLQENV